MSPPTHNSHNNRNNNLLSTTNSITSCAPPVHKRIKSTTSTSIMLAAPLINMNSPVIVVPPEPQDVGTSFGWGDFPLVEAPVVPLEELQPANIKKRSLPPLSCSLQQHSFVDGSITSTSSLDSDDSSAMDICECLTEDRALRSNNKKVVTFSTVSVREYSVCLGDHPWCAEYPLTLDWSYESSSSFEVDEYEARHRRAPRTLLPVPPRRLTPLQRRQRLLTVNQDVLSLQQLQVQEAERLQRLAHERQQQQLLMESPPSMLTVSRTITPGGFVEATFSIKRAEDV